MPTSELVAAFTFTCPIKLRPSTSPTETLKRTALPSVVFNPVIVAAESIDGSGIYYLRYFTKDKNNNIELVKSIPVSIDVDYPELYFNSYTVEEIDGNYTTFEVFSVLERLHPDGLGTFRKGIIPLLQGGLFRQPMTENLSMKAHRYVKLGLTCYDACYAALAEDFKGAWLTFDEKAHKKIAKENVSFLISKRMPKDWNDEI